MRRQTLFFIVIVALVALVVVMVVNSSIAQFSIAATSARSHHHLQIGVKIPKGSFQSSKTKSKLSSPSPPPPPTSTQSITGSNNNNTVKKFVIINFDDSHQSDYTYAKPILDKYGFKATFFEVCNWIDAGYHDKDISITWQQIAALQKDGMDIESHTMTHPNLDSKKLPQSLLDYEIGQSQQCLINHGFNPTIFAYPNGVGSDDPVVVNTVAKYYNLARTDSSSALTFLDCNGGNSGGGSNDKNIQGDCRPYFSNGTLSPSNRYSINSWAHKHIVYDCSDNGDSTCTVVRQHYNNTQMFEKFVTAVNSQNGYNNKNDGVIRAIPIIVYHIIVNYPDLSYSHRPIDTTLNLFDAEMKYLHDNGFKVITMSDLGYDKSNNHLYIKTGSQS